MTSRFQFFILTVAIIMASGLSAQTGSGTLKGKVYDKNTGETLPFANVVVLAGNNQIGGGASDFDGGYTVKPIAPGTYNVKCVYVGYNPRVVSGVVIKGDKITFQDFALESGVNLEEVIVVDYVQPLIDKDGGASGGTVSRSDIDKMSARTATSVATTIGGVSAAGQTGNNEGNITLRGARSDNTYVYIDGIKVRGGVVQANLPKSAIEEVSVITGGIPANYGDATGGIISITTRGASSETFGGIDLLSSGFRSGDDIIGIDPYGQTQVEGFISAPLLFKKGEDGAKGDPLLGFFLSANFRKFEDTRPSAVGHWYLRDDVQEQIEANPTFLTIVDLNTIPSLNLAADFLTMDDFVKEDAARNSDETAGSAQLKFDLNLNKNSVITVGGSADLRDVNEFRNNGYTSTNSLANIAAAGRLNSLLNYKNNANTDRLNWRGFTRFTQRFSSGEDSKIKNAFYTISVDYSKDTRVTEDRRHRDSFFNYGHVGKFETDYRLSFDPPDEAGNVSQNGITTAITDFTAGDSNPILTGAATQLFTAANSVGQDLDFEAVQILSIPNGDILDRPYGFFVNVGTPANYYFKRDNGQFRLTTSGTADIGDHAVTLGVEYEQRVQRGFDLTPVGLWTRARQLANSHIEDISDDVFYQGFYQDPDIGLGDFVTIFYPQVNVNTQSAFDRNLRVSLGLDPEGNDFNFSDVDGLNDWIAQNLISVDNLDSSQMSLDMFSPDDLLLGGANLVTYYGYDHHGNILNSNPSIDDYFNEIGSDGYRTRAIDAYRPLYVSGYLMDKFAFDDIIFNVGVRVDRFDANQKVLKDEYIVGDFYTAGNNPRYDVQNSNIGSDYVLYVDDPLDPTPNVNGIRGFRDGDQWFDANGTPIDNPEQLNIGVNAFPYLKEEGLSTNAFEDYDPAVNVMPRVSFSFPISDEAVFFAHYDILTQRPERGVRLELLDYDFLQTQNNVVNNPNLRPTKTIDYELGFQQVLSRSSSLKLSAFYRDMRDMIQVRRLAGAFPEEYLTYRNIDFGTVKGITLAFDLRRTGNTRLNANYTLQFADGTGSNTTTSLNLANSGQPNLQNVNPLNFDQRHAINITMDYRYGSGKDYNGPVWFGQQFFANTGLNIIGNLGSGTPYSNTKKAVSLLDGRTSGGLDGTLNGARLPSIFRLNAQLDKNITLKFGKDGEQTKTSNLNIYLLVNNLLNSKNAVLVYPFTGSAEDDGFLATELGQQQIASAPSPEAFETLYNLRLQNPYNYATARTIQLGVKLDF